MTKKQDTAEKPNRKTSQRIPVPRLSSRAVERMNAEMERWCTVRDQRVGETTIEDLRWAIELKIAFEQPLAPPSSLEDRYGAFVRLCVKALDRVQRPRRAGESNAKSEVQRQDRLRLWAKRLLEGLEFLEPSCARITDRRVVEVLSAARANQSASALAFELKTLGQVWPNATKDSLRKAEQKTRQPES